MYSNKVEKTRNVFILLPCPLLRHLLLLFFILLLEESRNKTYPSSPYPIYLSIPYLVMSSSSFRALPHPFSSSITVNPSIPYLFMSSSSYPALIPPPSFPCPLLPIYLLSFYVFIFLPLEISLLRFLVSTDTPVFLIFIFLSRYPSCVITFSSFTPIFLTFSCLYLPLERLLLVLF